MIRSYAAGFIFTTSLPPTVLAGAMAAVRILRSDEGRQLRQKHKENVEYLRSMLVDVGIPVERTPSHIIPVAVIEISNSKLCPKTSLWCNIKTFNFTGWRSQPE